MQTKIKHYCLLSLFAIHFYWAFGQTSNGSVLNFKGHLYSGESKAAISEAIIAIPTLDIEVPTNEFGYFSIEAPASGFDSLTVYAYSMGFQTQRLRIPSSGSVVRMVYLSPFENELSEANVVGKFNVKGSTATLSTPIIKALPSILGEPDVFRTLEYRAGFVSLGENSVGLSVRGGEASQNLILLDETPIFGVSHLFGFMSNISSDAISGLKAHKGGFSSAYGGRISSVLKLEMKEGGAKKTSLSGGIGVLAARLALDGPIIKDKLTYLISARRTYVDAIIPYFNNKKDRNELIKNPLPDYYFGDINAKINWNVGSKDKISALGFAANDRFAYDNLDYDLDFSWQNLMGSTTWKHFFGNNTLATTNVSWSKYQFSLRNSVPEFGINFGSSIQAYRAQSILDHTIGNRHSFSAGIHAESYQTAIGVLNAVGSANDLDANTGEFRRANIGNIFGNYRRPFGKNVDTQLGLRISGYEGSGVKYFNFEPRAKVETKLGKKSIIYASYDRMAQYIHQLYGSGFSLPVDVWYPSTPLLKPQRSHQVALGFNQKLVKDIQFTYEIYYKTLDNQPELVDGALLIGTGNLDQQTALGFGNAFAACEFEIEKQAGKTQGWISYTLARTNRWGYPGINNGATFSPRQDVRHNLSVALTQEITKRISFTSTLSYRSGLFAWVPEQRIVLQNTGSGEPISVVPVYENRSNVQLPSYLRWDIGAVVKFGKKLNHDLTFSVVNVTNRKNPFFYILQPEYYNLQVGEVIVRVPEKITIKPVYLFPILPSITWNFKI